MSAGPHTPKSFCTLQLQPFRCPRLSVQARCCPHAAPPCSSDDATCTATPAAVPAA